MSVTPDPSLTLPLNRSMSGTNMESKCTTYLIVQNEEKGAGLWKELVQALQITDIKIINFLEAAEVCGAETLNMIWVHVPLPVQEDVIATIKSLRYRYSNKGKNVSIIAITDEKSDVDFIMHGFDEVYVTPLPKDVIYQKHQKCKIAVLSQIPSADNTTISRDMTSTPESTISIESVKAVEYSQSSTNDSGSSGLEITDISISDLKSTLSPPVKSFFSESSEEGGGRSPLVSPQSLPVWCRVEHATKEKQRSPLRRPPAHTEKERRERIKDSCDQLRVLLPYVKGRKTDMASILEMTVEYLKIVNAALPQDFQSHVIDIMTEGNSVLEGRLGILETKSMANKKLSKKKSVNTSQLGKLSCTVKNVQMNYDNTNDQAVNNRTGTRSLSQTDSSPGTTDKVASSQSEAIVTSNSNSNGTNTINGLSICKRECSNLNKNGSSKAKRPHMAVAPTLGDIHSSAIVCLPSGSGPLIKEAKKENTMSEVTNQNHHYNSSQYQHLFTEGDTSSNCMFSCSSLTNDMYPYPSHTPLNASSVRSSSDLTTYGGMYFDGAFYHYYSPLQDTSSSNYFIPGGNNEYVNPNAILPMTSYTSRSSTFSSAHKFDRTSTDLDRLGMGDQNSDMFNNNSNCFKPNNS